MNILLMNFWKVVNSSGGAEKVLCNMANEFVKRKHNVTIVVSDPDKGYPFYFLDEKVKFINLNGTGKEYKANIILKIKREILRAIGKLDKEKFYVKIKQNEKTKSIFKKIMFDFQPDIIINFDPNSLVFLQYVIKPKTPIIAMLHGSADGVFTTYMSKTLLSTFSKVAYIQTLIKKDIEIIKHFLPDSKIVYIPNIVNIEEHKFYDKTYYKVITVGRIEKQKQQHLLIESFKKIAMKVPPEWRLEIVGGTGDKCKEKYRKYLKNYVDKYFSQDKVSFTGPVKDVNQHLLHADIFAFPSSTEGFGLALTEAMAAGLPAIGYKSCPSVNELIIDGYNGFLCDDGIDDFADKLKILMSDAELRKKMGQNARESMKQFAPEKIWDQWEALIKEVVAENKNKQD